MATTGMPFYTFWTTVVNSYCDRGLISRGDGQQFSFFMNKSSE